MAWSRLSTDFDPDEETANFGTRLSVLSAKQLYDVVTFATIENTGEIESIPEFACSTCARTGKVALALDSSLHVVAEDSDEQHEQANGNGDLQENGRHFEPLSIMFASAVDSLCWSPCGNFVLAGLRAGSAQLVHIPSRKPLTAMVIADADPDPKQRRRCFVGCSIRSRDSGTAASILLTGRNGKVTEIGGVDLHGLGSAFSKGDFASLKAIQGAMKIASRALSDQDLTTSYYNCDKDVILTGSEGSVQLIEDETVKASLSLNYAADASPVMIKSTRKMNDVVLCLDSKGHLHFVCPITFMTMDVWAEELVTDIEILQDEGCAKLKLLMLTRGNNPATKYLQLRGFPEMNLIYKVEVNGYCHLLSCRLNHETPLFLEGALKEKPSSLPANANGIINHLRMRGICETVLESRLDRLLRRLRFAEAESFAAQFGLPLESVHQAKANWIIEQLSPWKAKSISSEMQQRHFQDLKETLGKIRDLDFAVKCCVGAAMSDLGQFRTLLHLARETIRNNADREMSVDLMVTVSLTLQRLETFERLCSDGNVSQWLQFSQRDLLDVFKTLLSSGDLDRAIVVWTRHSPAFAAKLSAELIEQLLELMSDQWNVDTRLVFLRRFIPDCLKTVPESLEIIAGWAYTWTLSLELSGRKQWPVNGYSFSDGVLKMLCFNNAEQDTSLKASRAQLTLSQQRSNPSSKLNRLLRLTESLKDLLALHQEHHLRIKLSDFLKEDKHQVVAAILDWHADCDEMPRLMTAFLADFIRRCGLDQSHVLARYLRELVLSNEACWYWHLGDAPWEARAVALLPFVTSVALKAETILTVVKSAPVPWSANIARLGQLGATLPHVAATLIKEQETLVEMKQILKRYECKTLNVSGSALRRLIMLMLKTNGRQGFADAMAVVKVLPSHNVTELHFLYLQYLLKSGEALEALAYLQECDKTAAESGQELAQRILRWAELTCESDEAAIDEAFFAFLSGAQRLGAGKRDSRRDNELAARISALKRRVALRRQFGIRTRDKKSIEEQVVAYVNGAVGDWSALTTEKVMELYKSLTALAILLQEPQERILAEFLKLLSANGHLGEAVEVLQSIEVSGTKACGPALFATMKQLVTGLNRSMVRAGGGNESHIVRLTTVLQAVTSRTVASCDKALLLEAVRLSRRQHVVARVAQQLHSGHNAFEAVATASDRYSNWRCSPVYKDKGLPLDIQAMAMLVNCLCECFETADVDRLVSEGSQLVGALQGHAHTELALTVANVVKDSARWLSTTSGCAPVAAGLAPLGAPVPVLVQKVLAEPRPDFNVALAYLLQEDSPKAMHVLSKAHAAFGFDCRKLLHLAQIGMEVCTTTRPVLVAPFRTFSDLRVRAAWGLKLAEVGVPAKAILSGGKADFHGVLDLFIHEAGKRVSLDNVSRFCDSFEIDRGLAMTKLVHASLMRLEIQLLEKNCSAPDLEIGKSLGVVTKALVYIKDEKALLSLLTSLSEELSPYSYELLEFVVNLMHSLRHVDDYSPQVVATARQLLCFLKQYERIAAPSTRELDLWHKSRPSPFPAMGKLRLPLTWLVGSPAKERFRILKHEFRLSNVALWANICDFLKLCADNIRIQAVQNELDLLPPATQLSPGEWNAVRCHEQLLASVEQCLRCMASSDKAMACAHLIVNHLPAGADKLAAAQMTYGLALEWIGVAEGDESAEEAFRMADKCLKRLRVESVLNESGLARKQYLDLLQHASPLDLILKLYEDDSIVERYHKAGGVFADINHVAEAIAEVHDMNITDIRTNLLERWLAADAMDEAGLDSTLSNFKLVTKEATNGEEMESDNFFRAVYVTQNSGASVHNMLIEIGFTEGMFLSTANKLRALKCLLSVADETAIAESTSKSADDVRKRLLSLYFIAKLEQLNLPFDDSMFARMSGATLVESVVRSCGHLPQGLALIVDLCVQLSIFDAGLWINLLQRMTAMNMVPQLRVAVQDLNHQPHLWHFPEFVRAWNCVLAHPFSVASLPATDAQKAACAEAVAMMMSCPMAKDLDLKHIHVACIRLGMKDLANSVEQLIKA